MSNNYGSADVVRALSATEINKLTSPQLKIALATVLNDDKDRHVASEGPSNADLMNELQSIKESLKEIPLLKEENKRLSRDIATLFDITRNQQNYLESRDGVERQRNLIIRGLSEDNNEPDSTLHQVLKHLRLYFYFL